MLQIISLNGLSYVYKLPLNHDKKGSFHSKLGKVANKILAKNVCFKIDCDQFYINNYRVRVPNYPVTIALHWDSLGRDILNCQIVSIKIEFMFFSVSPDMQVNFDN